MSKNTGSADLFLVYSREKNDLIGFIVLPDEKVGEKEFYTTFRTHVNTTAEKVVITAEASAIVLRHSKFANLWLNVDNEEDCVSLLSQNLIAHRGCDEAIMPHITFIAEGRGKEDIVFQKQK